MMKPDDRFTVQRWPHQPWVTVWDPLGCPEAGCHAFLTFWAWQDVSPRALRRWARQLAEAWTGLRLMGFEWPTATPEIWTAWATAQLARPMDPQALAPHIETLYLGSTRFGTGTIPYGCVSNPGPGTGASAPDGSPSLRIHSQPPVMAETPVAP